MKQQPEIQVCKLSCHFLKYSLIWPNKNEEFKPSKRLYIKQCLFALFLAIPNWLLLFSHLVLSLQGKTSSTLIIFNSMYLIRLNFRRHSRRQRGLGNFHSFLQLRWHDGHVRVQTKTTSIPFARPERLSHLQQTPSLRHRKQETKVPLEIYFLLRD